MNMDDLARERSRLENGPRVAAVSDGSAPADAAADTPPAAHDRLGPGGFPSAASPGDRSGRRGIAWAWAARLATLAAVGCAAGFLWAIESRMTRWEIEPFVLLIYGAALGATLASFAARRAKRLDAEVDTLADLRFVLWAGVALVLVWVWFPAADSVVGWALRQVSVFRFGP